VDNRASVLHPDTAAHSAQIFQSDRALSMTRLADILALGAGLNVAILKAAFHLELGDVMPTDPALGIPVAGADMRR